MSDEAKSPIIKSVAIDQPACSVHGPDVPVINITDSKSDAHGITGRWCLVCIFKALEQAGCKRVV